MQDELTLAQKSALKWLRNRNGTGVFGKDGVLIAAGERAPIRRQTWNRLIELELMNVDGKRISVTNYGRAVDLTGVYESEGHRLFEPEV